MKLEVGNKYKIKIKGRLDPDTDEVEEVEINIKAELIEVEGVEKLKTGDLEVSVQLKERRKERLKHKIISFIEKL